MNKARLEAFSDGVFSIVMTLLVIDIKVPEIVPPVTGAALAAAFVELAPHILLFIATFVVLAVAWINHHFLFHAFAKTVDRWLNLINLLFLMTVVFVPFTASFFSAYYGQGLPTVLFGANLLLIALLAISMLVHIKHSQPIDHVSNRLFQQARFRSILSIVSYLLGITLSFLSANVSLFFFIFPVVFNIIPGTLDLTEKLFGFNFGAE